MVLRLLFLLIFASLWTTGFTRFLDGPCHNQACGADGECIPVISRGSQKYWCKCNDGFSGKHCEMPPCPDICHNEGECVKPLFGTMADYNCKCAVGFEGRYCEKEVESSICSELEPCGEHGTCFLTNSLNEYGCECVKGYRGVNCTEKEPCPPGHCVTGTCSEAPNKNGFVCNCPDNFQGERCDVDVNECAGSPCYNGGICENTFGDFVCHCLPGFLGERCELNATALFPKRSECSIEGEDVCQNGGVCRQNYEGFWTCSCPPMFEGPRCEKDINECKRLSPCQNGGTCTNFDGGFECICPIGIEGEYCEIKEDFCSPNPCESGICVSKDQAFCLCPPGKTGQFCDKTDFCLLAEPCKNGAQCHTNVATGEYTCLCKHGFKVDDNNNFRLMMRFRGSFAKKMSMSVPLEEDFVITTALARIRSEDTLVIVRNPLVESFAKKLLPPVVPILVATAECVSTASTPSNVSFRQNYEGFWNYEGCQNYEGFWTCSCPPMFEGPRCEKDINECKRLSPCQNGGTCTNFDGGFECICPIGIEGEYCEIKEDFCSPNPCESGICVSKDQAFCLCPPGKTGQFCDKTDFCLLAEPCKNGAQCHTNVATGEYTCLCKHGFKGKFCEEDVDECSTGRGFCYNNGTCKNTIGGYTCDCPKPFGGEFCEEVVTSCRPNPCRNGGMCLDRIDSFECACPSGYSGARCEILPPQLSWCSSGDCKNGGSCHLGHCVCPKGFTGIFCEKKIVTANTLGRCLFNPCLHGFCHAEGEDSYRCRCYPGFTGRNCEIDIDDCKPGLCVNSGECIDLENDFTCACKKGYSGKHCEHSIDLSSFNKTEMRDRQLCEMHGCERLAGNGLCDQECNLFACEFDGGDCSANAKPYERCLSGSYCARVFHDGNCDESCDNEECLFDGFDCAGSSSKCPHADFCEKNYANGFCDTLCNNTACGFDGGDCESPTKEEKLNGEIVLVVLTSPSDFRQRLNTFLMTLSGTLRSSVKIRIDGEGPMIFEWKDGKSGRRVSLENHQPLSVTYAGVIRGKRTVHEQGVIVWLTIDVTNCRRDCFSDISTVAEFLGRAEAQKELDDLGMPIKEARVDRKDSSDSPSSVMGVVIAAIGVCILVAFVGVIVSNNRERTRKRRIINAPTWIPPSDSQYKMMQQQVAEYSRSQSLQSLYGPQGDIYSSIKRSRLDSPMVPSFSGISGPYQLAQLPFQNQVFAKPPVPQTFPDYSDLHEKAASFDPIPLPIDTNLVNERSGPGGETPLILLARNRDKTIKHILEDVENLYKAGANLDAQNEDEQTALFIASRLGRLELAKKLLELGANATKMDSQDSTPLHQAAHNGDIMLVKELLQYEAVKKELNEVDKMGRTALMCSSFNDFLSTDVAAALIEAGADPSYQGDKSALTYRGRSAMHYAAQYGNIKTLKFLIEKGANKDAQDLEECTPLILAVRASCVRSVRVLLEAGASQDISDQTDCTPRTIARDNYLTEIFEILEKARKIYDEAVVPLPASKPKAKASASKKPPQKRKPAQPLTPPHSDGATTPEAFHLGRPLLLYALDSPRSDGSSNTTTSPAYTNQMSYDSPDWATMMPPTVVPCHLQQTFTSDYNSAGSSFESSSFFHLSADYPNTSNPGVWK